MSNVLVASHLRVKLGERYVLEDVSLSVGTGEAVAVLGPSGAGKSTLFKVLAGELIPEQGDVQLLGHRVSRWPLWRRARVGLGYVPQTPSVLGDLSVKRNIETFCRALGRAVEVESLAARVALKDHLSTRARDLSGGERRRLELLRALLGDPKVLVCDEPLSGVDPASAAQLTELLAARVAAGTSLVLADHRLSEVLGLAHRALLLVDGRVEVEAPARGFLDRPEVQSRLLG